MTVTFAGRQHGIGQCCFKSLRTIGREAQLHGHIVRRLETHAADFVSQVVGILAQLALGLGSVEMEDLSGEGGGNVMRLQKDQEVLDLPLAPP